MRAAVVRSFRETPRCEEFEEPAPEPGELVLAVRGSALTQLTRSMAAGLHYAGPPRLPCVAGADGVGRTEDGRRVYAAGSRPPFGMMAERTVVLAQRCVPVPEALDDAVAAAVPNAALSSWLALKERARLAPGESVLVLGATGVAGRLAVGVARLLGAGRIVAAGRNPASLSGLPALGADATVDLRLPDPELRARFVAEASVQPFDVVLDYLWGHPAEVVLAGLTGHGSVDSVRRVRYVSIGSMAGPTAAVPSAVLRSSGVELLGSGIGSVPRSAQVEALARIFVLAAEGRLPLDVEAVPLDQIATAWHRGEPAGRRLVVVP